MFTPLSKGVRLSDAEIRCVHDLRTYYDACKSLPQIAESIGIELHWLADWPTPHGVFLKRDGVTRLWLPESTEIQQCLSFAHEIHHWKFAPNVVAFRDLGEIEIARYEGRATSFASIFAMPTLTAITEEAVYRAFGPHYPHAAHYRIQHFQKHGW